MKPIESSRPIDFYQLGVRAIELFDTIRNYKPGAEIIDTDQQQQHQQLKSSSSKSTTSSRSRSITINAEQHLLGKFTELYTQCTDRNCFFHYLIFHSLVDVLHDYVPSTTLVVYVSSLSSSSSGRLEANHMNLISTFFNISMMSADNCRLLYATNNNSYENVNRFTFFQPVNFTIAISKFTEAIMQKCLFYRIFDLNFQVLINF